MPQFLYLWSGHSSQLPQNIQIISENAEVLDQETAQFIDLMTIIRAPTGCQALLQALGIEQSTHETSCPHRAYHAPQLVKFLTEGLQSSNGECDHAVREGITAVQPWLPLMYPELLWAARECNSNVLWTTQHGRLRATPPLCNKHGYNYSNYPDVHHIDLLSDYNCFTSLIFKITF